MKTIQNAIPSPVRLAKRLQNRICAGIHQGENAVRSLVRDRRGDAGTNWLLGVLIGVVIVGIILVLLGPQIKVWWQSLSQKISDLLATT